MKIKKKLPLLTPEQYEELESITSEVMFDGGWLDDNWPDSEQKIAIRLSFECDDRNIQGAMENWRP